GPESMAEFWAHKRYWDLIAVRYLITSGRDLNMSVIAQPPLAAPAPVPLMTPRRVNVACTSGPFDTVAVTLSTYGVTQYGTVLFEVLDESDHLLARAPSVDAATLVDNGDQSFSLPEPVCVDRSRSVVFRVQFQPSAPGAVIAAWEYPGRIDAQLLYKLLR